MLRHGSLCIPPTQYRRGWGFQAGCVAVWDRAHLLWIWSQLGSSERPVGPGLQPSGVRVARRGKSIRGSRPSGAVTRVHAYRYSMEAQTMQHSCSCCKETSTHEEVVTLRCPDGTTIQRVYTQVDECACSLSCLPLPTAPTLS